MKKIQTREIKTYTFKNGREIKLFEIPEGLFKKSYVIDTEGMVEHKIFDNKTDALLAIAVLGTILGNVKFGFR